MALRNPVKNKIETVVTGFIATLETEQIKHKLTNPRYKIERHTHDVFPDDGRDRRRNRGWGIISLPQDLPCSFMCLTYLKKDGTQGYWIEGKARDASGDIYMKRWSGLGPEPDEDWVFVSPDTI
jgi:hypothetical protein